MIEATFRHSNGVGTWAWDNTIVLGRLAGGRRPEAFNVAVVRVNVAVHSGDSKGGRRVTGNYW